MHRNTILVIGFLAVVAAMLVGLNIGKRLQPETPLPTPLPTTLTKPLNLPTPQPNPIGYNLTDCGLSFTYEPEFNLETASSSAQLTSKTTQEQINIVCVPEIPKPALPPEKVDEIELAGNKAMLYHDTSAKDGSPLDAVILTHPNLEIEIGIFGFGEKFQNLLKSIKFE